MILVRESLQRNYRKRQTVRVMCSCLFFQAPFTEETIAEADLKFSEGVSNPVHFQEAKHMFSCLFKFGIEHRILYDHSDDQDYNQSVQADWIWKNVFLSLSFHK
jgi:hypothetical protein